MKDTMEKNRESPIESAEQRIISLENKIEKLEKALQALLTQKEEQSEKEQEKAKEETKPVAVELSEEEKCLPQNWPLRFQWRRRNLAREGEEYIVIPSPGQDVDNTDKSWVSLVQDEDVKGAPERILIRNQRIQNKFRSLPGMETFEEVRLNLNSIEISSPFSPLFHYAEKIAKEINEDESTTAIDIADMYALSMFCTQGPVGSMFQDIKRLIKQGLITAEQQWALFRPGINVATKILGEFEILRAKSIRVEDDRGYSFYSDSERIPGARYIVCNQIAWNGKFFGQREREIRLQKFPGSRKLVEFDVCPLDSFPLKERQKIIEEVVERGKKWKMLCESPNALPRDCDTRCLPLVSENQGYWDLFAGEEKRSEPVETRIAGRVIVDPNASAKASKIGTMTESYTLSTSEIEPFTLELYHTENIDSQYVRCAALIEVFSLVDHLWYRVPVMNLKEPDWMPNPWNFLELSVERKQLLRTLVNAHTDQVKRSGDLINKKGKGLVFLFHGQPGLGKTLTAEALSESIQHPLYRVNIGLLTANRDWEPGLETIFRDAHSWQAVLLLDEAEVVMEARSKDRMQQNSWCSVLTKHFRSRINIAVHYDDLSLTQRTNLWKLFLGNVHPEHAKTSELLMKVDEWSKLNLNGRQIRNVVLTAEALALGQLKYLKMDSTHVDTVLTNTLEFNEAIDDEKKRRALKVGSVPRNWL